MSAQQEAIYQIRDYEFDDLKKKFIEDAVSICHKIQ